MSVITSNEELLDFCNKVRNKPFISVDTEFSRDKTYYPRLCLLQISDGINSAAVDTLLKLDLSSIYDLLFDDNIVKVFHAAKQDLEIVFNLTGKLPNNIFDTQVAASVCGYGEQIGYDALVYEILKIRLDKSEQYTDWVARPLSEKKIAYALADVIHLSAIYPVLLEKMQTLGREDWIKSDIKHLIDPQCYNLPENKAWLRIKFNVKSEKYQYIVMKMAAWREQKAKEMNVPRMHFLDDATLLNISNYINNPHENIPNNIKQFYLQHSNDLSAIARNVKETNSYDIGSSRTENTRINHDLYAMLKMLLRAKALKYNVTERIIATTDDLDSFILNKDSKIMQGWRYEIFGNDAEKLKQGKIAICYQNNSLVTLNL